MKYKIILIHGFHKSKFDMVPLNNLLAKLGYESTIINLPLTFKSIEEASIVFNEKLKPIIDGLQYDEKICLVGHSTGGLIIRYYLATGDASKIHRCVLIATPNQGYKIADMIDEVSKFYINTHKTLKSLKTENVIKLGLRDEDIEVGCIAGNKTNITVSRILESENDGRIEVEKVKYEGMDDFIVVPFEHNKIHKNMIVARLVINFLTHGKFRYYKFCGMVEEDYDQVRDIYYEGIKTNNATFQTKVPTFKEWDVSHIKECRIVAKKDDEVLGWVALTKAFERYVYRGVAEVSIYVKESQRGQGVAKALLKKLIKVSEEKGYWTLESLIFVENKASIKLHEKCGFRKIGVREKYGQMEDGTWRDVLLMERRSKNFGNNC